jgi:hypothetical protein
MKAELDKAEEFYNFGKLLISLEEVRKRVAAGEELIFEFSSLNDTGEDYTALFLDKERIGCWRGF